MDEVNATIEKLEKAQRDKEAREEERQKLS